MLNVEVVFTTLPPALLLEQLIVVLLLERALVSQILAKEEHGRHKDLRGSDRRNVTPFVPGGSCCIAQAWAYWCVFERV
jgi:hypothetical protein